MKLFMDTEFNGYKGDLISLALVDENGEYYYHCIPCMNIQPWVKEHVIPVLGIPYCTLKQLQNRLEAYLSKYESVHIISDWPDDIKYFADILITGPGTSINTPPLTMEIRRDLDCESAIPHNALEDARAIRLRYYDIFEPTMAAVPFSVSYSPN